MKFKTTLTIHILLSILIFPRYSALFAQYDISIYSEFKLDTALGQCRAVPVDVGHAEPNILFVFGIDKDIDAFMGMFFFPTGPLKFAMYTPKGEKVWEKSLHKGNIPGTWFNPVFPFDLDMDGIEEIYFVHNTDADHPLDIKKYHLAKMDPQTGEIVEHYPWQGLDWADYTMSQRYRHFIFGGYDQGKPVLVTAQGTYTQMQLQGWNQDMTQKWDIVVKKEDEGSRSSHSCPVIDIDFDGTQEFFYGERCISLADGSYKFIADQHVYHGHSDVVAPILILTKQKWYIFTARETGYGSYHPPRVVMFKDDGTRLWTDLEIGHMDMGWTARIGENGEPLALAVKIGGKKAGPEGFYRTGVEEFVYEPFTGKQVDFGFSLYERLPVDVNGDGIHELIGSGNQVDGKLKNNSGETIYDFGDDASAAIISKFLNLPGEQLVIWYPDGTIKIAFDKKAKDTPDGIRRFNSTNYKVNQKLTAVGYNLPALGGL